MNAVEVAKIIGTMWWFVLPALVANMAPVFAARFNWLPELNRPLDAGKSLSGIRILGDNKTVRGLVVGVFFGSITALIQYFIGGSVSSTAVGALLWGALLGVGALGGDAAKSFIKRRRAIAPGSSWQPWDQIDVALGVLVVSAPIIRLSVVQMISLIAVVWLSMFAVSMIGVRTHIKQSI